MSTPSSSPSFSSPSPTNSSSNSGGLFNNGGNLTSLYLYTFVATITLLLVIFGALVARSIHLRRRRNAAFLAAIAAGTYVPPRQPPLRNAKRRIDPQLPEPALWEVHTAPHPHDPEKGWAEMLPVAGATLVPVTRRQTITPLRRAAWRHPRWLSFRSGRDRQQQPVAPDATATTRSTVELPGSSQPLPPPPPPEPVCLAVLISMPTRTARGRTEGPPIVEIGVAHVSYAEPCGVLLPHAVQCT